MKVFLKITAQFIRGCFGCLLVGLLLLATAQPLIAAEHFVTRSGTRLMLDGKPYRFAGGNLDYLALAADSFGKIGTTTDIYYPSHAIIDDGFATLNKMNGTVTRVWSSASQGCALCIEPEQGKFNETALRQLDYVVYSASKHHIRLILLFVDPWGYYTGGIEQYKKWRSCDFFRDPALIADYKLYVSTLINRKNTYTGIAYKDDPAILAWEPGNELRDAPIEWEREIAHYIKSLDPHHLIISSNDVHGVEPDRAAIPEIDILSRHCYPFFGGDASWTLDRDRDLAKKAGKVLVIDEFGWDAHNGSIDQLKDHLNTILGDVNIGGDMFWALRGRKDNGEYMAVPGAMGDWWALYYPGRKTPLNEEADMRLRVQILSEHAAAMSGAARR